MKTIGNPGGGSCLFYSYATSLMYYIKSQEEWDPILNKLSLPAKDKSSLLAILNYYDNNSNTIFTDEHLKTIQAILAPHLRNKITEKIMKDIQVLPIIAATIEEMHKKSTSNDVEEMHKKSTSNEARDLFKITEFGKIPGINNKLKTAINAMRPEDKDYTAAAAQFYQENQEDYRKHLNNPKTWGSHDMLISLHDDLFPPPHGPKLEITENGKYASGSLSGDMIINNVHFGTHWESNIPAHIELKITRRFAKAYPFHGEKIARTLVRHQNIETDLQEYVSKKAMASFLNPLDPEKTLRRDFVIAAIKLKDQLLCELLQQDKKNGSINLASDTYKQLAQCEKTIQIITDPTKSVEEKVLALNQYEQAAKAAKAYDWKTLAKVTAAFLVAGVCVAIGVAVGTFVPVAGNIVGGLIGAKLGSVAAVAILSGSVPLIGVSTYAAVKKCLQKDANKAFVSSSSNIIKHEKTKLKESQPTAKSSSKENEKPNTDSDPDSSTLSPA